MNGMFSEKKNFFGLTTNMESSWECYLVCMNQSDRHLLYRVTSNGVTSLGKPRLYCAALSLRDSL